MIARPDARIYQGHVMHMRLIPRTHRFRYRVFSLLIDLDRIGAVCDTSRLLRHNRFGIVSLHDRDHGPRDGGPLRPWVDGELAKCGLARPERVELLSFPRMWGYVFNPLSVYYCFDIEGGLYALIYEVKNTFGDQISYVLPAGPDAGGMYRQSQSKEMYVSPFIEMDQTYRFDLNLPDARLALRIRQAGPEGETLIATHSAEGRAFSDRALMAAVLSHPLMSLKVIAAIHWEALRLFLKGVKYVPMRGARAAKLRMSA